MKIESDPRKGKQVAMDMEPFGMTEPMAKQVEDRKVSFITSNSCQDFTRRALRSLGINIQYILLVMRLGMRKLGTQILKIMMQLSTCTNKRKNKIFKIQDPSGGWFHTD